MFFEARNLSPLNGNDVSTPTSKLWQVIALQNVGKMQNPVENLKGGSPSILLKPQHFSLTPHGGIIGPFIKLCNFTVGADKILSLVFSWNIQLLPRYFYVNK